MGETGHAGERGKATTGSGRLIVLDVLRGIAIFGILLMNIQSFGLISSEYINPKAVADPATLDWIVWLFNHLVADEKFITILTMLFGAGVLLMASNSRDDGPAFERRFRQRMGWLLVFGLLHAVLLWPGDILAAYAICGVIVVRFRNRTPDELIMLGVSLLAVASILWVLASAVIIHGMPEPTRMGLAEKVWTPTSEMVVQETERLTSGWFASAGDRAVRALGAQVWMFFTERLWRMVGMMLIGMALLKLGFLSGELSRQTYRRVAALGVLVGMPVILAGLYFNEAVDWEFRYSFLLGRVANHWGSVAVSLSWTALAILLVKGNRLRPLWEALLPVGRLAMSNYIGQTIICAGIFYGFGLGLFATLGQAELLLVVFLVWGVQLVLSAWWYRVMGQGPLERLWRYLASR